ncbi:thiamine phosphate synthase [Paenibacillus aquistagni]|uniref:thiamine phosphate synthase n=1 Tax=Paenibacillus aquistagni TaxID=1852522 RepID=UPI000B501F37|nr:thiamine phosphate synthase [Paenibacillus aquistagni]
MTRVAQEDLRRQLQAYLVMGSANCAADPVYVLEEAIRGGITMFQYREKGEGACQGADRLALGKALRAICRSHGIPFIVNDDVELALLLEADGVHVGQEDELAADVRKRIGHLILGVSAHTVEEVERAIQDGADYLGLGPIYPTSTKLDARPVQGLELIRRLRMQGITIPLVGIGGITPYNAGPVIEAGADGVAVVSAITQAAPVSEAAALLKEQAGARANR